MATIESKSWDEKVECFYDSDFDKDTVTLTLPSGLYDLVTIRLDKHDLDDLIRTLQDFNAKMRFAGVIK